MALADTITKPRQRNWAWIWLAYTGFLFLDPIMEPSLPRWLGTLAVFVVFLGIFAGYVRTTDEGRPTRYWMIVATFLLGLITFPWNGGGSTFFIYTAAFLPFTFKSTRVVLGLFALEAIAILTEGAVFNTHGSPFYISWQNILAAIFLLFIIGGSNIFFAAQKRAECALREAQQENFALAAVAERERIARDLHDVLGHTLSVIVLKAELAKRLIELDPQRAMQEIADVENTARTALSEVRETIGGYRSQGLAAELEQARNTLRAAGVVLDCDGTLPQLGDQLNTAQETVLALALREAVTNIVRHANATRCSILFTEANGFHSLRIEDNGPHPVQREGNGLRGMRERVNALGGRLSIMAESGMTLLIELPGAAS
jgi:two-component system, NarL family, sensor histidine kinase DesK